MVNQLVVNFDFLLYLYDGVKGCTGSIFFYYYFGLYFFWFLFVIFVRNCIGDKIENKRKADCDYC